jgi:hypothetical protein
MIQVAFDTNALVAGLRSKRGASFAFLESIEKGIWKANIPVALALEYEAVLKAVTPKNWETYATVAIDREPSTVSVTSWR